MTYGKLNLRGFLLEVTSRCQAQCIFCPWGQMKRKNQDMPFKDALNFAKQAYNMGFREFYPQYFGDGPHHPQYPELLREIKSACPKWKFILYTHGGTLWKEEIRQAMLRYGDRIVISIDGASDEVIKRLRPGVDFNRLQAGVKLLWEESQKMKSLCRIIIRRVDASQNEKESWELYTKTWSPYCHQHVRVPIHNWRGAVNPGPVPPMPHRECTQPFDRMSVLVNGDVTACCSDWEPENVVGNAYEQPLKEIWHGEKWERFRQYHREGRRNEINLCAKCEPGC